VKGIFCGGKEKRKHRFQVNYNFKCRKMYLIIVSGNQIVVLNIISHEGEGGGRREIIKLFIHGGHKDLQICRVKTTRQSKCTLDRRGCGLGTFYRMERYCYGSG
jgi:hypothetical protein